MNSRMMKSNIRLVYLPLALVLSSSVVTSLSLLASGAASPPPPTCTKIAFATNRDGNYEVYVMNPDGSGQTRLTNNPASDSTPAWSPDGTKIAFATDRDGNQEIYVMNADGSNQTRLTNNPAQDHFPAWSPDGQKIAFTRALGGGDQEIMVMNADGTGEVNLTNHPANDQQPAWSPDGVKLAFASSRGGHPDYLDIFVMNANGTGVVQLTTNFNIDYLPAWSPDGTKIAFTTDRPTNPQSYAFALEVFVMNADGSNQTNLTNHGRGDGIPSWSPDGSKLVFVSDRDSAQYQWQIYTMNADGSGVARLTNTGATDYLPAWGQCSPPPPPCAGANLWSTSGPAGVSYSLAINPATTGIVYTGTDEGVFKSSNCGQSWTAASVGLPRDPNNSNPRTVFALAHDPQATAPGILYAGLDTGGVNQPTLFKSLDGGATWNPTVLGDGSIMGIALDPSPVSNPATNRTIYAGMAGGNAGGVYKSTNGGATFTRVGGQATGLLDENIQALSLAPSTPNILYAGTLFDGVFKTTDGGVTWSKMSNGLPLFPQLIIRELAIHPTDPNTVYAATTPRGVYKTTDGGANWIEVNNGIPNLADYRQMTSVAIDPLTPTTVYVGTEAGVFKSANGGASWAAFNSGLTNFDVQAFVIDPLIPRIIYAGTVGGVFRRQQDAVENTQPGSNVSVQPVDSSTGTSPATLTFAQVTQAGTTELTMSSSGPPPPAGFQLGAPPTYYELSTTASYTGLIQVCINYNGVSFFDEAALRLFHFENGQWVDITSSLDTLNNVICGSTSSLSPFAIFQRTYQFSGFFAPVANPPTINVVNAGSAVPVKFSLGGNQGLDIFAAGYPQSQTINCDTTSPQSDLEATVTAGSSSLSYDPSTGQYTYVWKMDKAWAGSCRQLIVKLRDGTQRVAYFRFK